MPCARPATARRLASCGWLLPLVAASCAEPEPPTAAIIAAVVAPAPVPLADLTIGPITAYPYTGIGLMGDTWSTTWAADGNLYATNDDGDGFGACNSNVVINKLVGNDPLALTGSVVSCMDDYGRLGAGGNDGRTWKVGGITSIDSVLYLSLTRDHYANPDFDGRQDSRDAKIIMSDCTDPSKVCGLVWSSEVDSNGKPTFEGQDFGKPVFIQYGQNGTDTADGADTYVYAISNDGFWNNGSKMILGRVRRADIKGLHGSDWSFYKSDGTWTGKPADASPIITSDRNLGQASVNYIKPLGLYVLQAWHYPVCCDDASLTPTTVWDFFQAPAPWGPWTEITDHRFHPGGYYNPSIVSKFISPDGLSAYAFAAGDYHNGTYYKLNAIPLKLSTTPSLIANDTDGAIQYTGTWSYAANRGFADYRDDAHFTSQTTASAQYAFTGVAVDFVSEQAPDLGTVDVFIDGVLKGTVDCRSATRQGEQIVFTATGLALGPHTIKVVKKNGAFMVVDGFRTRSGASMANDTVAGISYTGSWQWAEHRGFGDYLDDAHFTTQNGDAAQYAFNGTGVDLISEKASDLGNADVYLDGVFQETVNCLATVRSGAQTVFSRTGLFPGAHTIRVVKTSGAWMVVDAFRAYSTITNLNDNAGEIAYTGSWTYASRRGLGDYLDDSHFTTRNGDQAQLTFSGTGISFVTEVAPDLGNVDVYLDGVFQSTVSCAGARQGAQTMFTKSGLSIATHTIKVVKSSGGWMVVDGFRVDATVATINDATRVTYGGAGWSYARNRGFGDFLDDAHSTTNNGDWAQLTFSGTGVDIVTEKASDLGSVDVFLDGVLAQTVNCLSATRLGQQVVFSRSALPIGNHTVKMVKKSGGWMVADAFRLYP